MKSTRNKKWRFVTASVGLLMLITLVLVACGSSPVSTAVASPKASPTPVSTPSSQAITSPLVGDYATTITKADTKDSLVVPGHWEITFGNNGSYTVFLEGSIHSGGEYQVKQNQLKIINDDACVEFGQDHNIPDAGSGTYTWMLEGKMLTLKAVHDTCSPRKLVLSTHPWVKQD